MKSVYNTLKDSGTISKPRGLKVLELENFGFNLKPYERFINFPSRKLSLKYIKNEFLWYLKGDRFDTSITTHASMWKSLINKDGSINSNYGQYIFSDGSFTRVAHILKEDKDSRRAHIAILTNDHLRSYTKDYPCTLGINFRIRDNKLNMSVMMRSNDAIYGLGNDLPAFSFLHEMMYMQLKEIYTDLKYGLYYHFANSFHIYEKHFEMLDNILKEENKQIDCPKIESHREVYFLMHGDFNRIPSNYKFTKWLNS